MDWLDKKIITRLLGNCRESYRKIAREFNVSCPTIKSRVDRLRQWGVIQRFTAELSQETLGVDWVMVDLRTDDNGGKTELLQQFEANNCIGEVLMLGGGQYYVFAEVCPSERRELISCLGKLNSVKSYHISELMPIRNGVISGDCRYTTRGSKINLNQEQLNVLRHLVYNARAPVNSIADSTGYSTKQIYQMIREFIECDGINLTLQLNLPSSGMINFIMKYRIDSDRTGPFDATGLVTDLYPEEHWFTFFDPEAEEMLHYMTASNIMDVQHVIQEISHLPYTEDVEAHIIYSTMKAKSKTMAFFQEIQTNGRSGVNGFPALTNNRFALSY